MKKLGKNNTSEANTIQAYSCSCPCNCSCRSDWDNIAMGEAQGEWNYDTQYATTISILN